MSDNGPTTALAIRAPQQATEYEGLVMHCSPAEAVRRVQELQAFVREVMVKGSDYGAIPGTDKPTLFQPGAQKLCEMYGLAPNFVFEEKREDWAGGFFYYLVRCDLSDRRHGGLVGNGVGSCNSKEDRYAWRWVWEGDVPRGIDKATLRHKEINTRNGKSRKFRLPNEDIYSLVNTIQKMACKRALIHAVLGVTRSGALFTQDVEDLPADVIGRPDTKRSWEHDEHGVVIDAVVSQEPRETEAQAIERYALAIAEAATLDDLDEIRRAAQREFPSGAHPVRVGVSPAYVARKRALVEAAREPGEEG